jgi:2-keto-4-pentenoate hydratase/2-oxohepta-3-ene-1,7-dioic acid hydratase in catechol pathway
LLREPERCRSRARLLAPVANPGKIIGAPANYADHIAEAKADNQIAHGRTIDDMIIAKWGLFLKARSSLVGPSQGVILRQPHTTIENRNDHEIELVAVIGRRGSRIAREDALKHVCGYAIGLDMTLRGPQFAGFRKSIDTYAVVGPWLVTSDEFGDPSHVGLRIWINGALRQESSTRAPHLRCSATNRVRLELLYARAWRHDFHRYSCGSGSGEGG